MMGMKYHLTSAILHPPMSGASGGYSNLWSSYRQTVVRCYASAESILEQSNTPPEKPGGQGLSKLRRKVAVVPVKPGQLQLQSNAARYLKGAALCRERAKRTVLVKDLKKNSVERIYESFACYGNISRIDASVNHNQVLVEFETQSDVDGLMEKFTLTQRNSLGFPRVFFLTPGKVSDKTKYTSGPQKIKCPVMFHTRTSGELPQPTEASSTRDSEIGNLVIKRYNKMKEPLIDSKLCYLQCQMIDDALNGVLPNCVTLPHGSVLSGLSTSGSDLDMVLHVHGLSPYNSSEPKPTEMEGELRLLTVPYTYEAVLRHVVLILRNFLPECLNVFPIVNAKVPIVRFQSEISHNSCDIKLDDHGTCDSILASCALKRVSEYDIRFKVLSHCLRHWARAHGLTRSDSGPFLTNFSITHLIIHYLQSRNILPSVEQLLQDPMKQPSETEIQHKHLGDLYKGFFKYYAEFDYSLTIDIYEGCTVREVGFKAFKKPLKIVNMVTPNMNIANNMNATYLELFVNTCTQTHTGLLNDSKNAYECF